MIQKSIVVDGLVVHYHEQQGSGDTALFVHGYPGRPQDFRWILPSLSKFRCICIALPGMDITPFPLKPMITVTARVDFLFSFMDALHITKCILVGHSMGGVLCTELACLYPQRIPKLVLISSVGPFPYRAYRHSKPKIADVLVNKLPLSFFWFPLMRALFSFFGFPKGVSTSSMRYILACAAQLDFQKHAHNLRKLSMPVLSLWSSDDPLIEESSYVALHKEIAQCQNIQLLGGGHNPQKKCATAVAHSIDEFCTG